MTGIVAEPDLRTRFAVWVKYHYTLWSWSITLRLHLLNRFWEWSITLRLHLPNRLWECANDYVDRWHERRGRH